MILFEQKCKAKFILNDLLYLEYKMSWLLDEAEEGQFYLRLVSWSVDLVDFNLLHLPKLLLNCYLSDI